MMSNNERHDQFRVFERFRLEHDVQHEQFQRWQFLGHEFVGRVLGHEFRGVQRHVVRREFRHVLGRVLWWFLGRIVRRGQFRRRFVGRGRVQWRRERPGRLGSRRFRSWRFWAGRVGPWGKRAGWLGPGRVKLCVGRDAGAAGLWSDRSDRAIAARRPNRRAGRGWARSRCAVAGAVPVAASAGRGGPHARHRFRGQRQSRHAQRVHHHQRSPAAHARAPRAPAPRR